MAEILANWKQLETTAETIHCECKSCPIKSKATSRLKVIPLFCTAHPLLRITLPHPRWRRFVPPARKEQTRVSFGEIKLLFAIIMPQIGWQLPGLLSKNKKMKEMCVIPKSAVVFHFAAVELWNYWNVLAEALDCGGCEACGTALRLSNCINEPVSGLGSLWYICRSNSESGETNISGTNKTHSCTRTTRGRPAFDVNTKFAAEFTFCYV